MQPDKIRTTIGLCHKAGALISGTDSVCEYLRFTKGKKCTVVVLEASDTSPNTHKKLTDKCLFYKARLERLSFDGGTLAEIIGKTGVVAAVCIKDESLCRAVLKAISTQKSNSNMA